jgi:3-hydroxybutyryl-CoA dehydrogenase
MSVTLPSILLFGDPATVAETARRLEAKGLNFSIINSTDEFTEELLADDLIAEAFQEVFDTAAGNEDQDVNPGIGDLGDDASYSVIIDCSIKPAAQKAMVLSELAELYPSAIIISSTIVCTATAINALLPLASQVVGAPLMPGFSASSVIELAPSLRTRELTHGKAKKFFEELGFSVEFVEDRVGLVFPRMIAMLINEAAFAVMEKVAEPADIDTAMKLGVNYPQGLLSWADTIGIDVVVALLDALHNEYREPRYRCCALLRQYVRAGWLGKRTGRGFFQYLPRN